MQQMIVLDLVYPNGRTHRRVFESPSALTVGEEFDAFGRRWRVIRSASWSSRHPLEPLVLECQAVSGQPAQLAASYRK